MLGKMVKNLQEQQNPIARFDTQICSDFEKSWTQEIKCTKYN